MNNSLQWTITLYSALIRLYPREFKLNFADELRSVFTALARDAASAGTLTLTVFCLRELRDFPINLLRTHLEKNPMSRIFDSESVRFTLRGVLAFVILLMTYNLSMFLIMSQMSTNAITFLIPGYFNDGTYHQALVMLFAWLIASVISGTIFAVIFGELPRLRWPVVLGMVASLPWSVPNATLLLNSQMSMANFEQNSIKIAALFLLVLVCGILAVALFKEQPRFRWFVLAGMLVWLPGLLTSEVYHFTFIKTDALLDTLAALENLALGACLAGMLGLLLKDRQKMFWLILAGVILYPLVSYAFQQINGWLLAPIFFPTEDFANQQVILGGAMASTIIGLLFGLPLSLIFVWLKKGKLPALPGRQQPVSA